MEKSFGLFFHLKKNKDYSEGELPVYMRITVNGIFSEISTKRKCNPNNWNVSTGRLNGKSDSVKLFNAYLDTLQQKVFEAKRKLIETDKELTAENIKNVIPDIASVAPDANYHMRHFIYDEINDTYTCPQQQILTTNGNPYQESKNRLYYTVKHYKTSACPPCNAKALCTKNVKGRLIERSEFTPYIDQNNET